MIGKKVTQETIQKIRLLRKKGWSLPEIKRAVSIGQTTIYRYVKGVTILPQYKNAWLDKKASSIKRKRFAEIEAKNQAENTIQSISKKEAILFLTALYWGEGSKNDFGLSNTDPDLVKIFVRVLKEFFGISEERLRTSIRIYEDLNREKCLKFWSKITDVPVDKFVSVEVLKGKKKGKLPYGMCRVRVQGGGNVLKYVVALRKQTIALFNKSPRSSIG